MSTEDIELTDKSQSRTAVVPIRAEVPAPAPTAVAPVTPGRVPLTWEQKFLAEDGTEDPTINVQPLETYLHYAARERLREENDYRPVPDAPWTVLFKHLTGEGVAITPHSPGQKGEAPKLRHGGGGSGGSGSGSAVRGWMDSLRRNGGPEGSHRLSSSASHGCSFDEPKDTSAELELAVRGEEGFIISPHERETAYRLMRVANWQVVFYLIYTDMAGWFSSGMTFRILGWGPALMVYTCFCFLAFFCGQILWKLYMALDSERYPIKSYGDIAERTFGPVFRNVVNTVQFLQLGLQVSTFIMLDGHALAALVDYKFCFLALNVFFALFGMCMSQMRTLRNVSVVAYFNFFISIVAMVLSMFSMALYDPKNNEKGEKIVTSAWVPREGKRDWMQEMEGAQIAVFAYGGASIFTEFMAEMRRPRDFWKAAITAQLLIFFCYLFYGMFTYAMQGQFTVILGGSNITNRILLSINGALTLYQTAAIGILYSHIAAKMVYRLFLRRFFHRPSISSPKSAPWWALTTVVYWALAWVIGSAIPNLTQLSNVIASALVLPLTYIIPPALLLGHWVQRDAMTADHAWRPGMDPFANRADSFKSVARWRRGCAPNWHYKLLLALLVLAGMAFLVVGLISSITRVKDSFKDGGTVAFSCSTPGEGDPLAVRVH